MHDANETLITTKNEAGLFVLDDKGWIQYASDNIFLIVNVDRSEIVGKNIKTVLGISMLRLVEIWNNLNKENEFSIKVDQNKKYIAFEFIKTDKFLWDSELEQSVLIIKDQTENNRIKEERDRNKSLLNINQMMPIFFNEFKNSITSISSLVEVILENSRESKFHDELDLLFKKTKRMLLRVDSLTLGGREVFTYHTIDVVFEIQNTVMLITSYADQYGVKLDLTFDEIPPLQINEAVIRAIVTNITRNAIDASKRNDIVSIDVNFNDNDGLSILFKDTGHGMSPVILKRCVDPFFTTKTFGSGIGLTLCKSIIDSVGGIIQITSEINKGTQVFIQIPIQ
ncbi:HAMP domain-containing histidine kinase [Myxococcota bacterium]|nr:HAMP domain-containing histidine kinase [Myxococcota bacterium]MBU1899279.1 HAMP domain-containing histidine kinase [Myxococcota bacterium]